MALEKRKAERDYVKKADGDFEAHLVALSCTNPPEGHARWLNIAEIEINVLIRQCLDRYAWIPPGPFRMGCSKDDRDCQNPEIPELSSESPRHRVTISRGFWMGRTEVTVGAWREFAQATQQKQPEDLVLAAPERFRSPEFPQGDINHPIAYVTWAEAAQYCEWAGGRLPTEAEWEYAARAGSPAARYGKPEEIAWYADNSGRLKLESAELWETASMIDVRERLRENGSQAHPVGVKTPNDFGLYDMLGNVSEYCADWYGEKHYQVSEERDPGGPPSGEFRWVREVTP